MAKEYVIRKRNGKQEVYARFIYKDPSGKRKQIWRPANDIVHAKMIYVELLAKYHNHGEQVFESERMSFEELADYYEKTYLIEPQYVQGRKVAGLRSCYSQKIYMQVLKKHFGSRPIRSITRGDLERFKSTRLATPTKHKTQRAIASVNRELALLSRMMRIAQAEGWIIKNSFGAGGSLISLADENKRERILSREEEERLLAACTGIRAHLKPIIILALDTGMRRGELFKLKWEDVDFENRLLHVKAFNTKTMQERWLAMTPRVEQHLSALYEKSKKQSDELVFGILDSVKKAFVSARTLAGLPDVRFHDLRHTAATRLVQGLPAPEVGRILGHTQINTTYRYINANVETARRAADVLAVYSEGVQSQSDSTVIH